jgi:hypothetical protein
MYIRPMSFRKHDSGSIMQRKSTHVLDEKGWNPKLNVERPKEHANPILEMVFYEQNMERRPLETNSPSTTSLTASMLENLAIIDAYEYGQSRNSLETCIGEEHNVNERVNIYGFILGEEEGAEFQMTVLNYRGWDNQRDSEV